MANFISIDTCDNKQIKVSITKNGIKDEIISDSRSLKSQIVLPLIDKLLKRNKISLDKVDEILFNRGPGSFTGLRVGASVVNALSYLLKKPINGKGIGELEEPVYNK